MNDKPGGERQTHEKWEGNLERVDLEIVRLAIICRVRLFDDGVLARILDNDARVCHQDAAHAFESLRGLLFLHFQMQKELAEAFGEVDSEQIHQRVWEYLRHRIGDQLGRHSF